MQRFQEIGIFPNANGITVKVGCITLVYQQTQLNVFHDDLARYLTDPVGTEKEIRKRWHIEQPEDAEATEERPTPMRRTQPEPNTGRETAEKSPR